MVAKLSNATIEHILLWALSVWKVYTQNIISQVNQKYIYYFYTTLDNQAENHDDTYTLQGYDGDSII